MPKDRIAIGWVVRGGKIQGTGLIIDDDWRPFQDCIVKYRVVERDRGAKDRTTIGNAKVLHNYGKRATLKGQVIEGYEVV